MLRSVSILILRRLPGVAMLLLVVSAVVFALLYMAPGRPEQILLGGVPGASEETIRLIRGKYHLDEPIISQYWYFLKGAVVLDFGDSFRFNSPALEIIGKHLAVSAQLALLAGLITLIFGIGLGMLSAIYSNRWPDTISESIAVLGASAPPFATAIVLLYVFSYKLGWFSTFGIGINFLDRLHDLVLPAFAAALPSVALITKLTKAGMIRELAKDHVTFAIARGVGSFTILCSYALRNALIPIVTAMGLIVANLIAGAVLVEVAFGLPGLGSLLVNSVDQKDLPMIQGIALVIALIISAVTILVDVLYLIVDPRIRFGRSAA